MYVPSPSWPYPFAPHAHVLPSVFTASEYEPAATKATLVIPGTTAGTLRLTVVPSPRLPPELSPHAQTVPSAFRARLCVPPAATCTTPVRPTAIAGVDVPSNCGVVVPVPSWPLSSSPQAQTVPSRLSARLCSYPA